MVAIVALAKSLKPIRKAKWAAPADLEGVDASHEATLLAERLRELARRPEVAAEDEDFHAQLSTSEDAAWSLSKALKRGALDAAAAEKAFDRCAASCVSCHAAHRDNTHRR